MTTLCLSDRLSTSFQRHRLAYAMSISLLWPGIMCASVCASPIAQCDRHIHCRTVCSRLIVCARAFFLLPRLSIMRQRSFRPFPQSLDAHPLHPQLTHCMSWFSLRVSRGTRQIHVERKLVSLVWMQRVQQSYNKSARCPPSS